MDSLQSARPLDPILIPLLEQRGESEYQKTLADIITDHIEPVLKKVVRRRLGVFLGGSTQSALDAEDLCSEITLIMLLKLREMKQGGLETPIENLPGFVANLAHQRCADYFRSKHPERWRLKTRLRYLLSHSQDFTIYEDSTGEWICGLSGFGRSQGLLDSNEAEMVLENPEVHSTKARGDFSYMVKNVLKAADKSIELDMLVMICARLTGIKKQIPVEPESISQLASSEQSILDRITQRKYLEALWKEIQELPDKQRSALLLNLRDSDGQSVLPLMPSSGAASFEEIADALKISVQELADLWNQLPLEDALIAERLEITRQQVINLRKSARERLARRMKREKQ
jgi:DNA-directed RNA polymerase specialized sigma24 family protein